MYDWYAHSDPRFNIFPTSSAPIPPPPLWELQQALRVGASEANGEWFSWRASRARKVVLKSFSETFAADLCIPGTPWDGEVGGSWITWLVVYAGWSLGVHFRYLPSLLMGSHGL